jgi:hypothetical protein
MVKTEKNGRFIARNRSSATSPAEEQYGVPDIAWNVLLLKMGPLENVVPCLLCVCARNTVQNGTRSIQTAYEDFKVLPERCDVGHVRIFLLSIADKTCDTSLCTASRLRHPCVHSQGSCIPSLHASLKTAEPLRVQLINCRCTSVCCCNPLRTAKRQLHPCGNNFKITATLCTEF